MQVHILGPLEVWDDGRAVELGAGRPRALLAFLALNAPDVVATDRLIEELWGGSPPATAAKALQNLVSQLRRSLGADAIVTRPPGYGLRLEHDDLDARRFERLAAEGRRLLEEDPGRAGQTLVEALGLWRGAALADFAYEDFAHSEITRLDELRLGAIEDRVDADLALSRATGLVSELEALVSAHPLRERLRGQLMLALYRSGRQAEALEVYREGRAALSEDLGLEPGAALRELEQAILNQDPVLGRQSRLAPAARTGRTRLLAVAVGVAALVAGALAVALSARDGGGSPTPVPDSLVKIDAETNEIVDVIPVGRSPGQVAVVGDYVLVSSQDDATLTRVEIRTGETTTYGAVGADMGLVAAGDRYAWVVSLRQDRVTRVDVPRLESLETIPLAADLAFASPAVGGGSLWIAHFWPASVLRYSLSDLTLERRFNLPFSEAPVEPIYAFEAAWVVLGNSGALWRIDDRSGEPTRIPTGPAPGPPAAGFGSIWSTSIDEGTLWRLDGVTGDAREILELGRAPFDVATGAGSVWVAINCDGSLVRVDPETEEVVATVRTGLFPVALAFGGDSIWVAVSAGAWNPDLCN